MLNVLFNPRALKIIPLGMPSDKLPSFCGYEDRKKLLWDKSTDTNPPGPIQIISRFSFSRFIYFAIHLDNMLGLDAL